MTTSQFSARFGASSATVKSVDKALTADGLRPDAVSANGLVISITSSVAQAERSLSTGFESYRLATGRVATANLAAPAYRPASPGRCKPSSDSTPWLRIEVAPPTAKDQSSGSVDTPATSGPTPCPAAVTAGKDTGGWTENQLAKAYSFNGLYSKGQLGAEHHRGPVRTGPVWRQ